MRTFLNQKSKQKSKEFFFTREIRVCSVLFLLFIVNFGIWAQPLKDARLTSQKAEAIVEAVGPIGITVSSLRNVLPFYTKVLKFKKVWISEVYGKSWEKLQNSFGIRIRTARLQLGKEFIDLNEYLTPGGRPIPMDSKSNDLWFQHIAIVVSDMQKAHAHLRRNGVRYVSTAPQRIPDWNKGGAGIRAFYFRDPDGHVLEIIYFPPDKGDPRWQKGQKDADRLFLGIDHTAIGVSSSKRSVDFYQNILGLRVAGSGTNYGIEQARLNNVKNARVKITTVKTPKQKGPGIEFLHYLKPGPGRPYPKDTKSHDLWHWQTILYVTDLFSVWRRLQREKAWLVSSSPVQLNKTKRNYTKAFLARDPDGHGLLFVER